MQRSVWMACDQLYQQANSVTSHIAALVLQGTQGQICSALAALRELIVEVEEFVGVDLYCLGAAVRIDVEEALLKHLEEGVHLRFVLALVFFREVDDEVAADLNDSTTEVVGLD